MGALPDWYVPEQPATAAAPAAAQPAASAAAPPDWYTPEPAVKAAPVAPSEAPTTLGTLKYLGGRAMGAVLGSGDDMLDRAEQLGLDVAPGVTRPQSPADEASKIAFGAPLGAPTGPVQRYGGDLIDATAGHPIATIMAPWATVASSLGSTGASDVNKATGEMVPDWLARVAGGLAGGFSGAYGYLKARAAMEPAVANPLTAAGLPTNKAINRAVGLTDEQFMQTPVGGYQAPAAQTAAAMGDTATPATIGQTLLDKARTWLGGQKAEASRDFNAIEAGLPQGSRGQMSNTMELLTNPGEGPPLDAPLAGQITARLNQNGARNLGETMPYDAMKAWRTEVGAAIDSDPSNGPLKQLYGALTKDMEGHLQTHGGDAAVTAFRTANEKFGAAKDFIAGRVGNLADEALTPEKVYAGLAANPTQTATRLSDLLQRGVIDQNDIGTIARGYMEQMGRNADGIWDPSKFTHSAIALRRASPEAENLLFRNTPERSAAYDAMLNKSAALHAPTTPFARANEPKPGFLGTLLKKGIAATAGTATGSLIPGLGEGAGEMMGLMLSQGVGHGGGGSNPLYRLPAPPAPSREAVLQSLIASSPLLPNLRQQR
jgi:hypothetical protein